MVIVPLLDEEHTGHALDLACRLAADRGARVLLLAPLFVDWELPLDAHFHGEETALRVELSRDRALAESYAICPYAPPSSWSEPPSSLSGASAIPSPAMCGLCFTTRRAR
jgi:hypothetical protein